MPSPSFESKTSRDSGSESKLIMDSKSEPQFMDLQECQVQVWVHGFQVHSKSKTQCRNAKSKSGFMDSESEIRRDAESKF